MADQYSGEGSSTSNVGSSDATVEINIKTLDSRIYSFQVDKNMSVSLFKDKIANEIGVPVGQQRLIFRGKVLKDNHLLSEYHVENGHTLHLVARQPAESQASSGTSSGENNASNGSRVNEASAGAPRNRVGQISHSVVLGTFNVADQVEGIVPDLTRVIGAVLNSIGVGSQTMANITGSNPSTTTSSNPGQFPHGNESEGVRGNVGGLSQAGNQVNSGQELPSQPFQSLPQVVQIPLATAAIPIPSLNSPIPDSLNTLSEFINRMEQNLAQNGGHQPNLSSTSTAELPRVDLPSTAQGLHTPEALSIVLRRAERLLSTHAVAALSHIAGRLEQEGGSSDPTLRGQIQAESVQLGLSMQHLGALLLELGRTILTLRMGQTPAESVVNAGPAVYISPQGPNPIMVQPFPLQTSPLIGGSVPPSNPLTFGPVGVGSAPRNINIHIHAGPSLAPIVSSVGARGSNGEGMQGEHRSGAGSGDSSASRMVPVRNIIATALPSNPAGIPISSAAQTGPGIAVTQPPSGSVSLSSVLAQVNSQIRNIVGNMQGDNTVQSGQAESNVQNSSIGSGSNDADNVHPSTIAVNGGGESGGSLPGCTPQIEGRGDAGSFSGSKDNSSCSDKGPWNYSSGDAVNSEDATENAQKSTGSAKAVPLGLGLGSLERKRGKQLKPLTKNGDGGTTSTSVNQDQQATSTQQILQSLAARSSVVNRVDSDNPSPGQLPSSVGQVTDGRPSGGQGSTGQVDMASVISQVMRSPALNGLLTGVSEETGMDSSNGLRNMLQQFAQSPQMRNAVNQIAQQVDSQDVENMFSGLGGQGGGIDFSRMFQQMMPIVSRALGSGSTAPQPFSLGEPQPQSQYNQRDLSRDEHDEQILQHLQAVAERIEHLNSPEDAFRALVENSLLLSGGESGSQEVVDALCGDEGLASEYVELLRDDIQRRLQDDSRRD